MKNVHCKRRQGCLLAFLTCVLLLAGCARSVPVRYYQLSALDGGGSTPGIPEAGRMVLGIGPVRLPEYLDRPQLVTRLTPNRLQLADSHRWVEPLGENIPRVLGENLAALLGTGRILLHPWPLSAPPDYQLVVEVLHFENESDGAARLVVLWSVKGPGGGIVVPERRSSYRNSATAQSPEAKVVALNGALGSFCREVAQEMKPFLGKPVRSGL